MVNLDPALVAQDSLGSEPYSGFFFVFQMSARWKDAALQLDLVEMQKTVPARRGGPPLWQGPDRAYAAKQARAQAIEEALAMG